MLLQARQAKENFPPPSTKMAASQEELNGMTKGRRGYHGLQLDSSTIEKIAEDI